MPRGYRCIVLAAVGWLALCGAKPPEQPAPKATPSGQRGATPDPSPTATTELYRPYPRVEDPNCYRDKDHDSADLCAQWRAALAAEEAARAGVVSNIVAGIGAVLSFASIILVVVALGQTRRANAIARRASMPHVIVSLDNFSHGKVHSDGERIDWINFDIVATNVGGTGCIIKSVSRVWGNRDEQPSMMGGMNYAKAVPIGETIAINPVSASRRNVVDNPILRGVVVVEGPFIEEEDSMIRFAFTVLPDFSSPHNVHHTTYDDPEWMSIDQRRRAQERRRWHQFWKPKN